MLDAVAVAKAVFQFARVCSILASRPGSPSVGMVVVTGLSWVLLVLNKIDREAWDAFRLEPGFGSLWYALMLLSDDVFWDFSLCLALDCCLVLFLARWRARGAGSAPKCPFYSLYYLTNPYITCVDSWAITLKVLLCDGWRLGASLSLRAPRSRKEAVALFQGICQSHLPLTAAVCLQAVETVLLPLWVRCDRGNPNVLFFLSLVHTCALAAVELS